MPSSRNTLPQKYFLFKIIHPRYCLLFKSPNLLWSWPQNRDDEGNVVVRKASQRDTHLRPPLWLYGHRRLECGPVRLGWPCGRVETGQDRCFLCRLWRGVSSEGCWHDGRSKVRLGTVSCQLRARAPRKQGRGSRKAWEVRRVEKRVGRTLSGLHRRSAGLSRAPVPSLEKRAPQGNPCCPPLSSSEQSAPWGPPTPGPGARRCPRPASPASLLSVAVLGAGGEHLPVAVNHSHLLPPAENQFPAETSPFGLFCSLYSLGEAPFEADPHYQEFTFYKVYSSRL